jgi:hypothetical protein
VEVDRVKTDKQIIQLIKEHQKVALPANRRRGNRNGANAPLSAWMLGAHRASKSKIESVCSGTAAYPSRTWGASSSVLTDRISTRRQLTPAQYVALEQYVFTRYRGTYRTTFYTPPSVIHIGKGRYTIDQCDWFRDLTLQLGEVPLRAILDDRLTELILLRELFVASFSKKLDV